MGGYNDFWLDYEPSGDRRTSLIVDPPDGRLPALTPEGVALRLTDSLIEDLPIPLPVRVRGAATAPTGPRTAASSAALVGFNSGPRRAATTTTCSDRGPRRQNEMVHDMPVHSSAGRSFRGMAVGG